MHERNLINISVLVVLLLFMASIDILQAQLQWGGESLTRGKVWETYYNSFQIGLPVSDNSDRFFSIEYPGRSVGANLFEKSGHSAASGYIIYGKKNGVAKSYTLNTVFYASSTYAFPLANAELITNYNMADPALLAEEIVTGAHHLKDLPLDMSHKSMVWSYPKYDDFVIHEFTIKNPDTASAPITDIYFGPRHGMWLTMQGTEIGVGSWGDEKYGWDSAGKFFYIHDDRGFNWDNETDVIYQFGPGPQRGDIGDAANLNPEVRKTELLSPAYFATICLDSAGTTVNQNILQYLGQGTSTDSPPEDIMARQASTITPPSRFLEVMTYQQPRMSWDEARAAGGQGGNKYERSLPEVVISCGPFNLDPGQEVTVVFAEVLGEMDRAQIVEGGVENIDKLATESLAALQANVAACREIYANGYDVVDPPPTPTDGENSLTLSPIGGGAKIAWPPIPPGYVDPDNGTNDFAGYKVYRSSYFVTGPWAEIADIQSGSETIEDGMVVYEDLDLPLGVGNYYGVTSYDDGGNESGLVNPNRFPVYPLMAPNEQFPDKVYVVPNPFRQHSGLLGSGEELRMEFIGLPPKCTIKIFTLAGDLLRSIEHNDGSGSEAWGSSLALDYQTNTWLQYVAPGFYIYHVESHVDGEEGKAFIGKFAIAR
jgi:hypothetical protein